MTPNYSVYEAMKSLTDEHGRHAFSIPTISDAITAETAEALGHEEVYAALEDLADSGLVVLNGYGPSMTAVLRSQE